ncbi:MAG: YggS family pyridoxal phosphate-dependent enzyme [Chthonomonadaceae bacterium]|nr:YggS family pyridoxal phosphate-dependent enzyme [Chthonomonadaceae bacterium]
MSLKGRWQRVQDRVCTACESVGRDPATVTVLAVTKTVSLDSIAQAIDLGISEFAESRLQESLPKIESLGDHVRWHFIGKLQSNKVKRIATHFDAVHTFESAKQVKLSELSGRTIDGLVEVNIAEEPQKSGVFLKGLDETVSCLLTSQSVRFRGLMTIGPVVADPEQNRIVFRRLAEIGRSSGAEWLSMGMSADFDVAIQEGATHVRVGSALFGERN